MIKKFSKVEKDKVATNGYAKLLNSLQPRVKVQLSGPSLIVKYSQKNSNLILTADAQGLVHLVDSNDAFNAKKEKFPNIAMMEAKNIHKAHDYPIFDLDWHDNSTKYITGGADPCCSVWDVETNKCLYKSFSHTRTVRSVKSCQSNPNLFASGGRDAQLFIYDTRVSFGSGSNMKTEYIPVINGSLIENGKEEIEAFTGISFYADEKTLLTTQSGFAGIKLWDTRLVSTSKSKKKSSKNPQPNPANTMIIDKSLPLQSKINQIIEEINNFKDSDQRSKRDIQRLWALKSELDAFETQNLLKEDNVKGLSSIHLSRLEHKILVTQIDHNISLYDVDKLEKEGPVCFKGFKSSIYTRSTLSPCTNFVISGSTDQGLHIWRADKPGDSMIKLYGGHTGEINCVDWSSSSYNFIASVGDDQQLVLWEYDQE